MQLIRNEPRRTIASLRPNPARAIQQAEDDAIIHAAVIRTIAFVGHVALMSVAQVSLAEAELSKVAPPESRLRLAAIGDAITVAIHARVLELGFQR